MTDTPIYDALLAQGYTVDPFTSHTDPDEEQS